MIELWFIIMIVMINIFVFIFIASFDNEKKKRRQDLEYWDASIEKVGIAKSKIDELRASIESLKDVTNSFTGSQVQSDKPDIEDVPHGEVIEYRGDDSIEEIPLSLEDVEFAPESSSDIPDISDVSKISEHYRAELEAMINEDSRTTDARCFKRIYLQQPEDMFRTIDGEQVIVRRYHKNLLRKLVGLSDEYNLTVNGYVDNILHNHFRLYKTEIDSLLSDKDKEDLNRDSYEWA